MAPLSFERLVRAFNVASELHCDHARKGTEIPYIAHLMAVAALVLEDEGNEAEAIAALLHDAVEDAGGAATLARIRDEFGDTVADIVKACSDTDEQPKPPWKKRKQRYLAHLEDPTTTRSVLRVSLADKVHNARAILADYRVLGEGLWERFSTGSADDQLWYYRSLARIFDERVPGAAANELDRTVTALERLVGLNRPGPGGLEWRDHPDGSVAIGRTGNKWGVAAGADGRYGITVADWDRPDWHTDSLADARQLCDELDRRPVFTREEMVTEWLAPD